MIISFISPIYNEENLINNLLKKIEFFYNDYDFEWIFIDDHSTDKSYEILENFAKNKDKIRLIKNPGRGKIDSVNEGLRISNGSFIKFVAGDDEVDLSFIKLLHEYNDGKTSIVHNGKIVDENNKTLGNYIPPYQLFNYDLDSYILNNISCPSWCWIFPREQAKKFFPIPKCEYEDLYLSFCLKKFTKVHYLKDFFYKFKQNRGQTFGNILKFDDKIGIYRSKRSLKSLSIMKNSKIFNLREKYLLSKSRLYFILYLKKKNILQVFKSELPFQRKLKLIIFRYFFRFYGIFQIIKYQYDNIYHFFPRSNLDKNKDIEKNSSFKEDFKEIKNKKIIFLKTCVSFPSSDGLTNQYYDFLDYFCSKNEYKGFLFCKKDFKIDDFLNRYKNIKNIKFINDYPDKFSILTIKLIIQVIIHKLRIKKNKLFSDLEVLSKDSAFKFYFHDISLYPLLLLNINKKKIIFSITDFQVNRLFKLIFISKGIFNSLYYFLGFLHCLVIEPFIFKKINTLHVYSQKDEFYLKNYFFCKNTVSIPNFNLTKRSDINEEKNNFSSNKNKILIMGDLSQSELFDGVIKLKNTKYFSKFQKKYTFVAKGKYSLELKLELNKIFSNIEFNEYWIDNKNYLNYLDSFKLLLFVDSIDFGLSNRVADALKSKSLIAGFETAFTGYNLKNFQHIILINNFYDLVYATNLKNINKQLLIENANKVSKEYNLSIVKDKWNSIL